ncbi:asparagine-rich protein-like [Bombyx mandarina]|uniref:Asparagine-rich protein-like n=1 Tax=Bombyx mandarina TaxID=7092 RepID=A0A6J2K2L7_BOMMA|nr:asparagine-rich protein-like [Bombyx mandarina]
MFVVEQKSNAVTELFVRDHVPENIIAIPETDFMKELRPDPFKDKYKALLKSRKTPRVELRYNVRDQVKNMKSDALRHENIDLLKTRWPLKKYNKVNGQFVFQNNNDNAPLKSNKFFMTTNQENEVNRNGQSKYFKRDLGNISKVDLKTVYNVGTIDAAIQNTTLSIETLIENLLEKSFDGNNTDVEINIEINNSNILNHNKLNHSYYPSIVNKTTEMNRTNIYNQNSDDKRSVMNKVNNYNELINILSKKIEEQNNTSMEMANVLFGGIISLEDKSNNLNHTENVSNDKAQPTCQFSDTTARNDNVDLQRNYTVTSNDNDTDFPTTESVKVTENEFEEYNNTSEIS